MAIRDEIVSGIDREEVNIGVVFFEDRWSACLLFDDGRELWSQQRYATKPEAIKAVEEWCSEIGVEVTKPN